MQPVITDRHLAEHAQLEGFGHWIWSLASSLYSTFKRSIKSDAALFSVIAYMILAALFIFSLHNPFTSIIILIRPLSGLFCLLLIPGALLCETLIPSELRCLESSFLTGLLLSIAEIQVLFIVKLFLDLSVALYVWLIVANTAIVLLCSFHLGRKSSLEAFGLGTTLRNRNVRLILVLGLTLRIILMILGQSSIAPDASLYADYARTIVSGSFGSSISNDPAVITLWNDTDFVTHQAFTYIFAVSWLLAPPAVSGPTLILTIIGIVLILSAVRVVDHYFGSSAASWVALILAVHPLFVFHSAIAYGPEIVSLLLISYGAILLATDTKPNARVMFAAGLLFGFVEVVWYANFYVACLILPILLTLLGRIQRTQSVLLGIAFVVALAARYNLTSPPIFLTLWTFVFVLLMVVSFLKPNLEVRRFLPLFAGMFFIILAWRWPVLLVSNSVSIHIPGAGITIPTGILTVSALELVGRFVFFIIFHTSLALLLMLPVAYLRSKVRSVSLAFVISGLLTAGGTLAVFGLFNKSVLLPIYLYSDSRFFLLMVYLFIISLGAFFSRPAQLNESMKPSLTIPSKRSILIVFVILLSFTPSYLIMPSGLALVNIEERYAWSGLPGAVSQIGDDDTVFLVDRAREFAWFTNRKSAVLDLSNMSLPYANASRELLSLAANFSTDYLIADGYTLAHWKTLDFLLLEPISIGTSVILGDLEIIEFYESSNNISAPALTLIAQTDPNEFGSYCRVFGFDTVSFAKLRDVSILDAGWNASNGGSITNASGEVRLIIGSDQNSTNTWRPEGFDFDQMVNSGFLLLDLEAVSAAVVRVEVWDENGIILRHAENLGNGLYYCPLGEVTIGDIRIVIEGSSGESIIVRSISVWQVENP